MYSFVYGMENKTSFIEKKERLTLKNVPLTEKLFTIVLDCR